MSAEMMAAEIAKEQNPMPRRRKIALVAAALGAALVLVGAALGARALIDYHSEADRAYALADQLNAETAEYAAQAAESAEQAQQAATAAEAQEEAEAAAAAALIAQRTSLGLTPDGKCPAGTVAGAVDDDGTESNCSPTNGGQQCVAYDDYNNCTQWYKP